MPRPQENQRQPANNPKEGPIDVSIDDSRFDYRSLRLRADEDTHLALALTTHDNVTERSEACIVFVGGVHGVGKTTLSRRVAELTGMAHVTAGALIRAEADLSDVVSEGVGGKMVPDVEANQERLLRGLRAHREMRRSDPKRIILDGHFCLLESEDHITAVPHALFASLNPAALVLVEADAALVARRLASRDGEAPSFKTVSALAVRESAHAIAVASRLEIPLYRARGDVNTEYAARQVASLLLPPVIEKTS